MEIHQIDLTNRTQTKLFLRLPYQVYRDTPQWVPPLGNDAALMLDPGRHPFYQKGEAAFFIGYLGRSQVGGRLAVLYNHRFNEFNNERTAFFYLFECVDDTELACQLFAAGSEWALSRGATKITGPKGFTVFDGLGLLVKGFGYRPALGLPYNLPYYPALVEAAGFTPVGELLSGYLPSSTAVPEKIRLVADRIQEKRGFRIQRFQSRRDLARIIPYLRDLYNASLTGTTGNMPISDAEVKAMANQMLWFADPRLIKIIYKGDELAGFLLAYPDVSGAVQRTHGRVLPFGWFDLLLEVRRTRWVTINGAGIVEKYRGLAVQPCYLTKCTRAFSRGSSGKQRSSRSVSRTRKCCWNCVNLA